MTTFSVFSKEGGLVLETKDAPSLLQKLPGSFALDGGKIGMPFTLDSCIRLTSMGYTNCPSPISYYYDWPRDRTKVVTPFDCQLQTAAFFTLNPHSYCLSDMGVGKTLSALWAADCLKKLGAAQRVLCVSTVSALERAWGDELFIHFPHRKFAVLSGSAERRRKLLAKDFDFYIINYDGLITLRRELEDRTDIDIKIFDEVQEICNMSTNAWKAAELCIRPGTKANPLPPTPWVWGMTGTPVPDSPTQAFGQCKLITPSTVPQFFTQFKRTVMEQHSQYIFSPRPEATELVYKAMRPAIRFKRDEVLDLPDVIYQTLDVEMSKDQERHYKEIQRDLLTEVSGGKITAMNAGVQQNKLAQIACGTVYDSKGIPREIDCAPRINVLLDTIDRVAAKCIVFVPFTAVTETLAKTLNLHWKFEIIHGGVSPNERNRIFRDFQNPDCAVDLLAHPECMAHGLTLVEASTIIWFAPAPSNKIYQQANARITRAGQRYVAHIVHLAGSTVERKAYKRLEARQSLQGLLLDMVAKNEGIL